MTALASFRYRAVDKAGHSAAGVIAAPTREDAYRRLVATGLTPLKVRQTRARATRFFNQGGKVKAAELVHFTHQFAVLLEARIPVVDCFRGIAEQSSNPTMRAICQDIAVNVQSGKGICDSMLPHVAVFGTVYLETLRAAERTGNMVKVLAQLAEMVEEQHEMRRQVRGALMYPIAVVIALTAASGFLVTFVVPRFAHMFASRGVQLPLVTRVLMHVGDSIKSYWYAYALGVAVLIVALRRLLTVPAGRLLVDRVLHRIPYLRDFLVGVASCRFASVLGLGLASGIGLIESLEMGGRSAGRPLLRQDVQMLTKGVQQGKRLGDTLPQCAYLPRFVRQLIRSGEEAGELPRMCTVITRHYARETRHMAKNASTVIEPVLIAGLTGVVLVIALAVFLPMWDMVSLME